MEKEREEKKVAVTPAGGEKPAKNDLKRWEQDKFTAKLMDKEIQVRECVNDEFPEVQDTEISSDEWVMDLYINDEIVGSITFAYWVHWGTGNDQFFWSTKREICKQVRKARREWLAQKKEEANKND